MIPFKNFFQFRMITMILVGFASALPGPLLGSTLCIRLAEVGMSSFVIGCFALLHLPQNLKFLWGSLLDNYPAPLFYKLGQRRGWAVFSYLGCIISCLLMGIVDPVHSLPLFITTTFCASLFAGFIYLIGVSYEIETLSSSEYEIGSACVITGYRIGLIVAGGGVLYLAHQGNWTIAYLLAPLPLFIPLVALLMLPEPSCEENPSKVSSKKALPYSFLEPVGDFIRAPGAVYAFIAVGLYGIGADFAHSMLGPFYLNLGFNKAEIATGTKVLGAAATFFGTFLVGIFPNFLKRKSVLIVCGLVQTFAWGMHYQMSLIGPNLSWLYAATCLEHKTGGILITLFIAHLWDLCRSRFASSKYTFLWALFGVKKVFLSMLGGWLLDPLGWGLFFIVTTMISLLSLISLSLVANTLSQPKPEITPIAA